MKFTFPRGKKAFRILLYALLLLFILINTVAFFHAYKFTHFSIEKEAGKKKEILSFGQKLNVLLFGVDHQKPMPKALPSAPYQTIRLQSNKEIECWLIEQDSAVGTVVLFHGYASEKSSNLDRAVKFREMGYNTLLVDFMGSGGSEGRETTIGYKEAEQVKTTVDYLKARGENNLVLYGTSLGATAIMKACNDYNLAITSIIIECPFSTLLRTAQNRFQNMGIPSFPMANLLVFWGGLQTGYNAFSHQPVAYAKNIKVPSLLLYGEKDKKVLPDETKAIFSNLAGPKVLKTFPRAGHENYLNQYEAEWTQTVSSFLQSYSKGF